MLSLSQAMRATVGFFTAVAPLILMATAVSPSARASQGFEARTISSRPDNVSGGDVLVEVSTRDHPRWIARLNGRDVTPAFRPAGSADRQIARLTGLESGKNLLEIRADDRLRSKLELVNHPRSGPMFSGPHQRPFICQTEANGLGPALDSNCSAKTIVQYYYKSTEPAQFSPLQVLAATFGEAPGTLGPGFKAYDPSSPPADVAQTTTSDGRRVRYVVRREVGTINRAVYEIQFLHEPGQPLPTPWTSPTPGWNGRLVYVFGGGCGAGYHQGTMPGPVGMAQRFLLARGYAVAASTLNVFGNNCNDRISAETLSMVKEHFIEQFGVPVHTIGQGPSGGSIQVHLIAQNYPGLLDGIIASVSYPDVLTTATSFTDCALLDQVFETSTQDWSEEQKTAVSGFATWRTCKEGWKIPFVDARNCDPSIPKDRVYDRLKNPQGVRCDIYSNEVNVLGRSLKTGLVRRPLDNVGVQYGLTAFNDGKIAAEQFLELNERMGGYDEDGSIVAARTEAEPEALRVAYQQGLVLTGGGGLSEVPIIDWRPYLDNLANGHDSVRSLFTRTRLIAAKGHANNHVIVVGPPQDYMMRYLFPDATMLQDERERDLLQSMDRWLGNIAADRTAGTPSAKIIRNKPADLTDGCWFASGERVAEPASYESRGECNQAYPPHGDARIAAGAPVTGDVLKCALKPVRAQDYALPLSADQMQRLKTLFPRGVCDYGRPGVGQQVTRSTWQKYGREAQDRPDADERISTASVTTVSAADDLTQPLKVSPDQHFLAHPDGSPFFWLGDIAWELFARLDRNEADLYLRDRAAKGFNVIQAVAAAGPSSYPDGIRVKNRYGEMAFHEGDVTRPNERYFDHVAWVIDRARSYGLRIALLPFFSINEVGLKPRGWTPQETEIYGRWLAARLRGKGITWVLGGDINPIWASGAPNLSAGDQRVYARPVVLTDYRPLYDAFAKGIAAGEGQDPFITYHPWVGHFSGSVEPRTSQLFADRDWLDMNMLQTGHFADPGPYVASFSAMGGWVAYKSYEPVAAEYASTPTRPVIDGEPRFEELVIDLKSDASHGVWSGDDAREAAYQAVFAGAAGHSYGHHSIWQFYAADGKTYQLAPKTVWQKAMNSPVAGQMRHLKALMLSRPYFSRVPDPSLVVGDPGQGRAHIGATRDREGAYAMIYLPQSQKVTVDLTKLAGAGVTAWWYDPCTGAATRVKGDVPRAAARSFTPPASAKESDWVLVLDDQRKGFAAPGGKSSGMQE